MYSQRYSFYRFFTLLSGTKNATMMLLVTAMIQVSACSSWLPDPYRLEFVQGNAITPEQVEQLREGMPKARVRTLLGLPVLQDPFHDQRWDYIFRYLPDGDNAQQSRLTLFFDDDILVRIDQSEYRDPETILPPPKIEKD